MPRGAAAVRAFFDQASSTISYVVHDRATMREIADLIHRAVTDADGSAAADISVEVSKLVERHPAYPRDQRTTD